MAIPSISMPDDVQSEVDDRRHSTKPRSEWVREAIVVRFLLEDSGDFDELLDEAEKQFQSADTVSN